MFGCQQAVDVLAGKEEGDALEARFLAGLVVDDLRFEPFLLRPAKVHAQKHLRPVLRLRPSRARVNDEEGVVLVVLAGEESPDLLGLDIPGKLRDLRLEIAQDLRVPFVEKLEEDIDFLDPGVDLLPEVEFAEEGVSFLEDFGGFLTVVVEAGLAQLFLESGEALLPGGKVKDAS